MAKSTMREPPTNGPRNLTLRYIPINFQHVRDPHILRLASLSPSDRPTCGLVDRSVKKKGISGHTFWFLLSLNN